MILKLNQSVSGIKLVGNSQNKDAMRRLPTLEKTRLYSQSISDIDWKPYDSSTERPIYQLTQVPVKYVVIMDTSWNL